MRDLQEADALIVGGGVAGLACARTLAAAGGRPVVVERGRGVGGRCATRRVDGKPVDHGVAFLHGSDPDLAAAIESVDATILPGWPARVQGSGPPCQPAAFDPGARRWAFAEGVSAFPKHLARGLEIRLGAAVQQLAPEPGAIAVRLDDGTALRARTVVLALALEQTRRMLEAVAPPAAPLLGVGRLLGMMASVPCLTLLAGYPPEAPEPPWDLWYPEDSEVLQLVSHDSSKRPGPRQTCLVLQARSRWSRRRIEQPEVEWSAEVLEEAGRRLGAWAARPAWTQPHRWRYARLEAGDELAAPIVISLDGGARLGLAGDLFAPGGGIEAAWLSGRRLAARLLEEGE